MIINSFTLFACLKKHELLAFTNTETKDNQHKFRPPIRDSPLTYQGDSLKGIAIVEEELPAWSLDVNEAERGDERIAKEVS